ncbi:hypothetical protein IMSHALPRED_000846 [Imshaugia aleurites]|uniref:BTB domain-containing protein n=1 Tax=Imshaugia aleurites TaxID=172621 RepID=A0A8H3J0Q5_9LECA|nr:hypothetical protein IMSHALPRED_000846 [Imshaugia aleurites]
MAGSSGDDISSFLTGDMIKSSFLNLPAEDPKVFELLISWLYRKTLNAISTIDEEVAKEEVALYIDLYLRACEWKMEELQNALMDRVRVRTTCEHGYFPRKLIKKNLRENNIAVTSPLLHRQQLHPQGASNGNGHGIETRQCLLKLQLDAGQPRLRARLLRKRCSSAAPKSKIRNPDRRSRCVYHKHGDGGKCHR